MIFGNTVYRRGGGLFIYDCTPTVSYNTIVYNRCTDTVAVGVGGGIYSNDEGYYRGVGNIIYFNESRISPQWAGNPDLEYSCSSQALPGVGNITDDPLFVDPSQNDFYLQAESPCIDTGDPASPPDPDGTRADMGALYYDQNTAPVSIALTPYYPPIQIPASGGSFDFSVRLSNNTATPTTCEVWIMAQLPNGDWYGPLLGPISLTLPGSAGITRDRSQSVPGYARAGTYLYEGRVGVYPDEVWDSNGFSFEKLATGGYAGAEDWENWGADLNLTEQRLEPLSFILEPCNPNPFNPTTTLRFNLPKAAQVTLEVFDVNGRSAGAKHSSNASPLHGWYEAGRHEVTFDGSELPSGVYIYQLQAGDFTANRKMVLLK